MIFFIVTILKHKYVVLHMEMYSVDSKNVVIYIYIQHMGASGGRKQSAYLLLETCTCPQVAHITEQGEHIYPKTCSVSRGSSIRDPFAYKHIMIKYAHVFIQTIRLKYVRL